MSDFKTKTGFANINNAQIYYETAGKGTPLVMIHAGIADSRQWNNEFISFAQIIKWSDTTCVDMGKANLLKGILAT